MEDSLRGNIVRHYHGRIPYAVPPMMVLPEIKDALEGKDVKIIVDCGIATGADLIQVWDCENRSRMTGMLSLMSEGKISMMKE